MTPYLSLFGAIVTAVLVGLHDHRTGKMPNAMTLSSLLLALALRFALEGEVGAINALFGALLVGLIPGGLFFFSRGEAIGGGDVKALAALGAWVGPLLGLEIELLSFALLATSALALEARSGRLLAVLRRSFSLLLPKKSRNQELEVKRIEVRFGPYLAAGTILGCIVAHTPSWPSLLELL